MTQKEKEEKNKKDIEYLIENKESFLEYYYNHTNKETIKNFNLSGNKILFKALNLCNYDKDYKKTHNVMKGRKATRSHESYIQGGKKSGETQKKNWDNKSQEEKDAWSNLMVQSHGDSFRIKISNINKEYYKNLDESQKKEWKKKQSIASKNWWNSLSKEEKELEIQKHIQGGAGWNHDKIKNTIKFKYGVDNIAQVDSVKKKYVSSINKTMLEKYGIMWACQLPQCNDAIGAKGAHTKPNEDFARLLDLEGVEYSREFVIPKTKYRYDFKVKNILIEINPTTYHNSTFNPKGEPKKLTYHQDKSLCAFEHGYKCIQIFDWDDIYKIVKLLKDRPSIGARQCKVKEVSKVDAMDFINEQHLQGYARDKIRLGLYYKDELVSIMTFNKPRYNNKYEYELIRYCSSMNITGGAEKLFKYFINNYKPKSIITYCDTSKFSGELYFKLGFSLLRKGRPSKHWYNTKTKEHYTDNLIRQQGFSRVVNHVDASKDNLVTNNNRELMIEHGFVEVYDCGQDTYVLSV